MAVMLFSVIATRGGAQEPCSVHTALPCTADSVHETGAPMLASGYRAWVGGGIGLSEHSALAGEWEAWLGRGAFTIGYQSSATDDFAGTKRSTKGLLAGADVLYGRLLGRAAAGVASARRCLSQGEQSGQEICTSERRPELAAEAEVLLSPNFAIHIAYFSIAGGSVGHSALVLGVALGRIAAGAK
jgi:hypothetical protein